MTDQVVVMTFALRHEADLAKAMLETHGIESFISADDCGGVGPYLSIGNGNIKLIISEFDMETAREILKG